MEILFQSHHAVISESMARRAERLVRKVARRTNRLVRATVRFEQDGPVRRVELIFQPARRAPLVAAAESRHYGPALMEAGHRMSAQLARRKRTPKSRARALART